MNEAPSPEQPLMIQYQATADSGQSAAQATGVQINYFGEASRADRQLRVARIAPPLGRRDASRPLRGRQALLERLILFVEHHATAPRVHVLYGLGGCGKTSLALELAWTAANRGAQVWWITAHDETALDAGMYALAYDLGASDEELEHRTAADVLWRRLVRQKRPWLLVIDNADDLGLLAAGTGPLADGAGWVRPISVGAGLIIVTTRDGDPDAWGSWCERHRVSMLSPEDAAHILLDQAPPSAGSTHDARELAVRLGCLPLALHLAARYLSETASTPLEWLDEHTIISFDAYRQTLDDGRVDMPMPENADGSNGTPAAILRSWELSLDLLNNRGMPDGRTLLRLLAVFADAPIAYRELLSLPILDQSGLFKGLDGPRLWRLLQALASLDLISLPPETGEEVPMLWIHPLIRDASRHQIPADASFPALLTVVSELVVAAASRAGAPLEPANWGTWERLGPHLGELLRRLRDTEALPADQILAVATAGSAMVRYLQARGLYPAAAIQAQSVLELRRSVPGEFDAATLAAHHDLARLLRERGRLTDAADEFRRVLRWRREVLGETHPDTLLTRHNLATLLRELGNYPRAEAELREIAALRRQILGNDHPETLRTRHNLVYVLYLRGSYAEAETTCREVLRARLETLGEDHPDTLAAMHNLVYVLRESGRLDEAEAEARAAIAARERVLGDHHPDTARTRRNLASVLFELGSYAEAESECRAALAVEINLLGPEHPDVLRTRHCLALILGHSGQDDKALLEAAETAALRARDFGTGHPDTLATRAAHALALCHLDRLDEAAREGTEVLAAQERIMGSGHREIIRTRASLAEIRYRRNHPAEARDEYAAALSALTSIVGSDHPEAVVIRCGLAASMYAAGDVEPAIRECRRLEELLHALRPDHPKLPQARAVVERILAGRP